MKVNVLIDAIVHQTANQRETSRESDAFYTDADCTQRAIDAPSPSCIAAASPTRDPCGGAEKHALHDSSTLQAPLAFWTTQIPLEDFALLELVR